MPEFILVADDDASQAELVETYLRREGFEVAAVHDGASALAVAARRRPDLAVLDVMMPGTDGLEVCRRLSDDGVAAVLLTARSTENDPGQIPGLSGLRSGVRQMHARNRPRRRRPRRQWCPDSALQGEARERRRPQRRTERWAATASGRAASGSPAADLPDPE